MAKAPSLSTKQQKKALGHDKKKKITLKSVLCTPYCVKWPQLIATVDDEIRTCLVQELTKQDLRRPLIDKHLVKAERLEALKKQKADPSEIEKQVVRNWLVCGVNAVTRAVERDLVSLVVVDRGAFTLTRHLMELCAVRGCTFVPLRQLAQVTAPCLSVTQLSALAVKSGEGGPFSSFVELVKQKTPALELPWLTVDDNEEESDESILDVDQSSDRLVVLSENDKEDGLVKVKGESSDCIDSKERHGESYVQSNAFDRVDNTKDSKQNLALAGGNENNLLFVDKPQCPSPKTLQGKRNWEDSKEQLTKVKKGKRIGTVEYHSANLHKLKGNENRKGKKKKQK